MTAMTTELTTLSHACANQEKLKAQGLPEQRVNDPQRLCCGKGVAMASLLSAGLLGQLLESQTTRT